MTLEKQPLGLLCINMSIEKWDVVREFGQTVRISERAKLLRGLKWMVMNSESWRPNELKLKVWPKLNVDKTLLERRLH